MEVSIHGAGVAGMSAALSLHRDGHSVTLIRRGGSRPGDALEVVGEEFFGLLAELGVLGISSHLHRIVPVERIDTSWPGNSDLEWAAAFKPTERRWAVMRSELEALMLQSVLAKCIAVIPAERRPQMGARGLAIDATGRAASLGRCTGAKRVTISELVALSIVATKTSSNQPVVEAVADGWWFAVGEADNSVVTFFTDADEAASIRNPDDLARRAACTKLLAGRFRLDPAGAILRRSAVSSFLAPVAGERWAAVGDAALAQDPLASNGLTFAVQSAHRLSEACVTGEFDPEGYRGAIDLKIARYRIARHRAYLSGAEFFGQPFWQGRSRLAV